MRGKQIKIGILSGLVLLSSIVFTLPTAGANTEVKEKGQAVTEEQVTLDTENMSLTYMVAEDQLTLMDKASGAVWYNIPPDAEDDTVAQGSIKKEMKSSLIVSFIDEKNNNFTANSQTSCISRSTNKVFKTANGILVEYDFSRTKEQFMIPVLYTLGSNHFSAEILFDQINEYGNNKICDIKLLPYFGAGKTGEDGFLLVPDGSGAIVNSIK